MSRSSRSSKRSSDQISSAPTDGAAEEARLNAIADAIRGGPVQRIAWDPAWGTGVIDASNVEADFLGTEANAAGPAGDDANVNAPASSKSRPVHRSGGGGSARPGSANQAAGAAAMRRLAGSHANSAAAATASAARPARSRAPHPSSSTGAPSGTEEKSGQCVHVALFQRLGSELICYTGDIMLDTILFAVVSCSFRDGMCFSCAKAAVSRF